MDRWALNAIILSHVNRVFAAASLAVTTEAMDPGTLVSLLGNLVWASSSFAAKDREEAATMAFAGAIAGSLGPTLLASESEASATLRACEREFLLHHDELVEQAWNSLGAANLRGSSSCAAVNAHVWELLFPQLRYQQSIGELARQIAAL